jgi:hypothetical protein
MSRRIKMLVILPFWWLAWTLRVYSLESEWKISNGVGSSNARLPDSNVLRSSKPSPDRYSTERWLATTLQQRQQCPKTNACQVLFFAGTKLHRTGVQGRRCVQRCLLASRVYLQLGWQCGDCPKPNQPLPPAPPPPAKAPVPAPNNVLMTLAPMVNRNPTMVPTKPPTKAPTKRPTKQPTKAPSIPCGNSGIDIVRYINNITLSKKTLSVFGTSALDRALQQLVASNADTQTLLSTCLEADQKRLTQRFAYLAFMFSTNGKDMVPSWFDSPNECQWNGIGCSGNTVNELLLLRRELTGTIPDDIGLWRLTNFNVANNKLVGGLPSSIGAWRNVLFFSVANNMLVGSLPSSIGNWTSIYTFDVSKNMLVGSVPTDLSKWTSLALYQFSTALFHSNLLNGTMPAFGKTFCPKNGTGGQLWADCNEIKCSCCNLCCPNLVVCP